MTEEQGFLSDKFDDWGSEPIPNGWSTIDAVIDGDRRKKRPLLWLAVPLLVLLAGSTLLLSNYITDQKAPQLPSVAQAKVAENMNRAKSGTIAAQGKKPMSGPVPAASHGGPAKNMGIADKANTQSRGQKPAGASSKIQSGSGGGMKLQAKGAGIYTAPISTGIVSGKKALRASGERGRGQAQSSLTFPPFSGTAKSSERLFIAGSETKKTKEGHQQKQPPEEMSTHPLVLTEAQVRPLLGANSGLETETLDVHLLETKMAFLHTNTPTATPALFTVPAKDFPITARPKRWFFSAGFSGGYAPRTIQIDQAQATNHYQISEGTTTESWFGDVGFEARNEVSSWLRSFATVRVGLFNQTIRVTSTSKEPTRFLMSTADNISFDIKPQLDKTEERRVQNMVFGTAEFGLHPLLFKATESGPFASAVVWFRLSQTCTSSQGSDAAPFENTSEPVALSYRIGYQHVFNRTIRAELYTAGMPDKLLATTRGLTIKPQLIGFGLYYQFR